MEHLTQEDFALLGRYFANAVAVSVALGHVSVVGSLPYLAPSDDPLSRVVLDAFGACMPGNWAYEGAEDRLREWAWESGMMQRVADAVA